MLHIAAAPVLAVTCNVSTGGLVFGSYDPFSTVSLDSAGDIAVTCDVATPYSVSLSPGSGTYANRRMFSGANVLNYNLYIDPLRLTVWGDGSAGTSTVSGSISNHYTVYGRIPARQNIYIGSYGDNATITVTF